MKKLALMLALCLVVTMLPGIGYTEDELAINDPDEQVEAQLAQEDLQLELADEGDVDEALVDGSLELDLDEASDFLSLDDEIGAIELADDGASADNAGEAPEANPDAQDASGEATPHVDADGPQLETNEMTLGIEDYRYLNAKMPDTGTDDGITYQSSDSSIAKVYKSGRVTGVSEGFACITAAGENGAYSECFVYVKKAPVAVSFGVSSLSIGKGEDYKNLKVSLGDPAEEYGGTYTLESENTSVVKVRNNSVLRGVKVGKARIKVLTYNGIKATLEVSVQKAPGSVTVSVDKTTLGVGEVGKMSYKLPKNTASAVTFTSEKPKIASVDSVTGEITALAVGKTRIYGETFNGKIGYVTVNVVAAPTTLAFESSSVKLGVGMELAATASVNEGAASAITYSIKNKKVATYTDGVLKGVKKGKTVLTAKTYNGLSATCNVQVVAAPSKVTLPYTELDIGVKQAVRLEPNVGSSASMYTYSTSNAKVVKVAKDGTITGVKKGTATITVTTYNGKKCTLKVNVVKAPGSVSLSPEKLELSVGETSALSWTFPKGTAAAVTFESSAPGVASVDAQTGIVTGVSGGSAVITVTTSNGKQAKADVTVLSAPEWIRFTEESVEIGVSQKRQLSVEMNDGASSPLKYKSANKKIATVSKTGVVTGVKKGKTTITVSTNVEGVTAKLTVTVLAAPKSVKFKPSSMTLNVGDNKLLVPVITKDTATGFTYSSSKPEVATVSEDGMLTALSRGATTVTVTTSNKLSAKLKVTVEDPLYPESVKLTNAPSSMKEGETLQLKWKVTPSGSDAGLKWESTDKQIAYVDDAGMLYAVSMGYATITAVSQRNPDLSVSFELAVESENVVLTIPQRTTSVSGIAKNLEKIDAIRVAANGQIDAMQAGGLITSADASKRKRIINNAFGDYAFPWETPSKQLYWNKDNSEGGAKDFKPGQVYYGIPYTQSRRGNNAEILLKGKYYYDSGKGYYILDKSKISGRKYYGNDCSTFVDAAIWGTNSSHSDDRTSDIMKSSAYKTIKGYENLRTGDLICKGHAHVVMFLYFVNAEKTKMMIIENGGIEPGTNTVHCMVMNVKWYTSRGYKVRRLKSLG